MACPAEPILASTLYSVLSDNLADGRHYKRRKIGTGCAAIDDALGGGLTYGDGGVCCMSGEAGTGMQEVGRPHQYFSIIPASKISDQALVDTRHMVIFSYTNRTAHPSRTVICERMVNKQDVDILVSRYHITSSRPIFSRMTRQQQRSWTLWARSTWSNYTNALLRASPARPERRRLEARHQQLGHLIGSRSCGCSISRACSRV